LCIKAIRACGNFLYLALKTLKDIEHSVHIDAQALGLERPLDLVVSPANVLGIEINEYAAELARVTVWIGELQWRLQHGYPFKQNPVLEPLDHIECRDALLRGTREDDAPGGAKTTLASARYDDAAHSLARTQSAVTNGFTEAHWPRADAVIGNPPFVGGSKKRRELGDETFEALAKIYEGRVPPGADLVCCWFDKALQQMKCGELVRAGLVSTQSIRNGANRHVLDTAVKQAHIYDAWSDEPWINNGAAVRVSMVGMASSNVVTVTLHLDGLATSRINANLSPAGDSKLNITEARTLLENAGVCFQGPEKNGPFDIDGAMARSWLSLPNVNGISNANVLKPRLNGRELLGRNSDGWVIDFGTGTIVTEASCFQAPFEFVRKEVKPIRDENKDPNRKKYWWRFGRTGGDLRSALGSTQQYIATAETAKFRIFVRLSTSVMPDKKLIVTTRADDATFGVLQSRLHEIWSLAKASMHGKGNDPRYTHDLLRNLPVSRRFNAA
jgi:type II restriction/modification system DNA methylase subunit YeeA